MSSPHPGCRPGCALELAPGTTVRLAKLDMRTKTLVDQQRTGTILRHVRSAYVVDEGDGTTCHYLPSEVTPR